jgi:AsmA-like C-terminal region
MMGPSAERDPKTTRRMRLWKSIGIVTLISLVIPVVAVWYMIDHAGPILRSRVIQTLSNRFDSKVELAGFQVSLLHGIEVTGSGLRIYSSKDPNAYKPGIQPLIEIREFRFQAALRSLFRSPMHIDTVYVKGMVLNIPPKQSRQELTGMGSKARRMTIFVDKFVCEETTLVINTINPEKPPLEFAISQLTMKDIGSGQPLQFEANLLNPKPVGEIQSTGLFGPWERDSPRDTPVQGTYSFNHADLSTIKGIGGTLSSLGQYSGTLNNIVVHGTTDTPDFRIASSGHPVPLHTEFRATVDGTCGDTYLKSVKASFLHSSLTASGSVVRLKKSSGHDIALDVSLDSARIEDLLKLGVRTDPPIMTGPVDMRTKLRLSPGDEPVADRLKLAGDFHVLRAHFTNEKVQGKLDSLSVRSQRHKRSPEPRQTDVPTDLQGDFTLRDGLLSFSALHFVIPGTQVNITGNYSLDGREFNFHGKARLDAKLSQTTTGWKSVLLKPVDPFFSKHGAGTEVPVKITGTESEPHFGLDFHHKEGHGQTVKIGDALSKAN